MAEFRYPGQFSVNAISVLYVDGECGVTEQTTELLQQEDDRISITTANSIIAGLNYLGEHNLDCIVSKYDIPGGTGLEFLKEIREQYPELPFVLFPEGGSEELASEAISAGVSDYIRDQGAESYRQLASRIVRMVREYHVETIEQRTNRDARELLERTTDAFIVLDTDWRFTYVNDGAEKAFDKPATELIGENIWEEFPEATETPFYDHYQEALDEGAPRTFEEFFEPWDSWYREHIYPAENGISVVFRDITEQKQHQKRLEAAKTQMESGVEAGRVGTWDWHIPEDNFFAGPSFAKKFGVDPAVARDGVSLDRFASAIHEDDRDRVMDAVEEAMESCGEYEEEYRVWNADDELRWVVAKGHVECDDAGNPLKFPGALTDITKRRRTERELRRHQAFLQESTDIVTVLNDDGTIEYISPSVEHILGYPPEELVGNFAFDYLHPQDREELEETFIVLFDNEMESVRSEGRFQDADGEWRWLELHASSHLEKQEIEGVVVNSRDISERKKQQRMHQLTIDRMTEGIVKLNEAWEFTKVNESAEDMFEMDADELLGQNIWDVFPETVGTRYYEELHQVMSTGDPTTFEEYNEQLDSWIQVHVYTSVEGGLSIYFSDVTELKEREQELSERHLELSQLNQFNELVQNLVQTLVTESTRTEIEKTVCDQLVDSEFYEIAWIGERSEPNSMVEPKASAGIRRDVLQNIVTEDTERDGHQALPNRAAQTRSVCVTRNWSGDLIIDPTDNSVDTTDIQAVLATPIEYEDALYGVLVAYTTQSEMFDEHQQSIFVDVGKTIGFAIAANERKDALAADTAIELTLDIWDSDQFFIQTAIRLETKVSLEGIVKRDETEYLEYISIADTSPSDIRDLADGFEHLDRIRVVNKREDECLCEVRMENSSIVETVAELGGVVTEMVAEQRHATVTVEISQTTAVSRVVEGLESAVDTVEMRTKQTINRPIQTEGKIRSSVSDRLTDKQRETLEAAYLAGYFEHPRLSTGEDVAESLGISPSTFHQHLRVGLNKLLAILIKQSTNDIR